MSSNTAKQFLKMILTVVIESNKIIILIFLSFVIMPNNNSCHWTLQYADSDDEHDGMMDTDEEVTNGRVTLLNGNGPPYFHGYLYMKGGYLTHLI